MDTGDTGLDEGCGLLEAGRLWVTPGSAEDLHRCNIPQGFIFSIAYFDEVPMDPTVLPPPSAPVTPTVPAPAAPVLTPVVEQPAAPQLGAQELGQLAQQSGGNAYLTVALAVIALLGLGIWKHLGKVAEQKHEQAMKQAELDAQKAGLNGAQPPPCQAAQAKLEAELASAKAALSAMETRLAAAEKLVAKVAAAVPHDIDVGEQEDRISKLEKSLKAVKASMRGDA
jgi:uncharacterized protein HemX